jgi:16S rRNA (cytosine967-C5)-methyltransferase
LINEIRMKSVEPVRALALDILLRFEQSGSHRLKADKLIEDALGGEDSLGSDRLPGRGPVPVSDPASDQDRRFLHALVLGTLRWQARLDAWIVRLSGRPLKRIEPVVRVLLRLGLFQLSELQQVPDYAAIDTTVTLARRRTRSARTVKFVNAVLRQAQRSLAGENPAGLPVPSLPSLGDVAESGDVLAKRLLWETAWPEGWTQTLLRSYKPGEVRAMAQAARTPPPLSIRINTLKIAPEAYRHVLETAGIAFHAVPYGPPEALLLPAWPGSVRDLPGYGDGWFYVQDLASMWVARLVNPQPGERILDLCAAPGSKTGHMAALANNRALITALEPAPARVALLRENIARLGLQNVTVIQTDALAFRPGNPLSGGIDGKGGESGEGYDKVLVDAPCSGSGTLRRHPEILRHLTPPRLETFTARQLALAEKGLSCLKPGGMLIYSTCSILPEENRDLVRVLLSRYPKSALSFEEQRRITETSDGFYAAILVASPREAEPPAQPSSQSSWLAPV